MARKKSGRLLAVGVLAALVLASLTTANAAAPSQVGGAGADFQRESRGALDADYRTGALAPTAQQRQAVAALDATATWNAFGTPATLRPAAGGVLAEGLSSDPVAAARGFLGASRELFRLSWQDVDDLALLLDAPIGTGRAVTFQQRFGGLPAAADGLVSLAVAGGRIVYVSSSLAGGQGTLPAATLTPQAAYRAASANLGRAVGALDVRATGQRAGWTTLSVTGVA
ncbi:MAG TPA: peptidase M36, partial [Candidatus Binatia bacterium]|nr:peptidase M36 [Candidatus Binatia bacterium]